MNIKSLCIAMGMAVGLFIYGYLFSTAGHDHASHSQTVTGNEPSHGHANHDHEGDHH